MGSMETAKESQIVAAELREPEPRRAHSALIRAVLRSLGPQRQRFWRGPGLVVIVCCLIQTLISVLFSIHIQQSGGHLTYSPGMGSSTFLGVPSEWWSLADSFGRFLAPAAVAWGWMLLAQMASRRLVDFFEDAAAPGLHMSLPLRFEAACRFAIPALIPLLAAQTLLAGIHQAISPVSVPLWAYCFWPIGLLQQLGTVVLPLLFCTAVWLLAPRWGLALCVFAFLPESNLWRDLFQYTGIYTFQMRQLPYQRLDLGAPGAQLYGLALLALAIWCLGRFQGPGARAPLVLVSAALLIEKMTSNFLHLSVSAGVAGSRTLDFIDGQSSIHVIAGLRGIYLALSSMPYYLSALAGVSGGSTLLQITAFPLLTVPIQPWLGYILFFISPIYFWLYFLALHWLLSRAPRDIINHQT